MEWVNIRVGSCSPEQRGGRMIYKHQVRIWVLNYVWVRELPSKGNYDQRTIVFQTECINFMSPSFLAWVKFLLPEYEFWASSRITRQWPIWGKRERSLLLKIIFVEKSFPPTLPYFPPLFSPHHFKPLKLYTSLHIDILRLKKVNKNFI